MKKLYMLSFLAGLSFSASAQNDTLLWENFQTNGLPQFTPFGTYPLGILNDTAWYNFDLDLAADGSPQGRPDEWYWVQGTPAEVDLVLQNGDTNLTFWSNSWLVGAVQADNWMVTGAIPVVDNQAVLRFKSASYQTPYYLDGFEVLVSTTTNSESDFSTQIYRAAECVCAPGDNVFGANYNLYTFTPTGAWIQGWDGSNLVISEIDTNVTPTSSPDADSARFQGILTEHVVNLGAYAGQTIYLAFHHNSVDDNLIVIDDILVTGTAAQLGVEENLFNIGIKAYPNPATDFIQLSFTMDEPLETTLEMTDVLGRKIHSSNAGTLAGEQNLRIPVSNLPTGTYNINVLTKKGNAYISFIKE